MNDDAVGGGGDEGRPSILTIDDDALAKRLGLDDEGAGPLPEGDEGDLAEDQAETPDEGEEETPAKGDGEPTEEEPAPEEEAEPEDKPEPKGGTPESARKPVTQFRITGPDGQEEYETDPEALIHFKIGGKIVAETLDKVVRRAQSAHNSHEADGEVGRLTQQLAERDARFEELRELAQELRSDFMKMLQDPAHYDQRREKFLEANTPEARAKRAEAELARERERIRSTETQRQATEFVERRVIPALQAAVEPLKAHVDLDEAFERYATITASLVDPATGRIPPKRWNEALALIESHVVPSLQSRHDARAARVSAQVDPAKAEAAKTTEKARLATTLAKKRFVRPLKPSGAAAGAGASAKTPVKPASNAKEANENILRRLEESL